jgi:RNA polymerase primary sigma factor
VGDFLEDMPIAPADAEVARRDTARRVQRALDTLSDKEREVLRLRFGLDNGREHTLEEIGTHFSLTRERIRQIETKALRKLQQLGGRRALATLLG